MWRRVSWTQCLFYLLCRKACISCGCSTVDHAPGNDVEDDQRMGRLLADSPCSHLTAKVKGGGGLRMYKRNRMIVTNPVVSRKDPTFNTTTYDWAPAGLNQTLVRISVKFRRLVVCMKQQCVSLCQLAKSHQCCWDLRILMKSSTKKCKAVTHKKQILKIQYVELDMEYNIHQWIFIGVFIHKNLLYLSSTWILFHRCRHVAMPSFLQ